MSRPCVCKLLIGILPTSIVTTSGTVINGNTSYKVPGPRQKKRQILVVFIRRSIKYYNDTMSTSVVSLVFVSANDFGVCQ